MQQDADDHRDRQRIALVAFVLLVQPDDLADVDREIPEQNGGPGKAEVHQQLEQQIVRVFREAVRIVQVVDARVCIVAAPEDRRIEDAADRARPDAHPLGNP